MTEIKELIEQRAEMYGPSWVMHGECLRPVASLIHGMQLKAAAIVWPWHAIFNKLMRALTSPLRRDTWVDIQGYAQLVIDMIDSLEGGEDKTSKKQVK